MDKKQFPIIDLLESRRNSYGELHLPKADVDRILMEIYLHLKEIKKDLTTL